jgi:hypothetical protein
MFTEFRERESLLFVAHQLDDFLNVLDVLFVVPFMLNQHGKQIHLLSFRRSHGSEILPHEPSLWNSGSLPTFPALTYRAIYIPSLRGWGLGGAWPYGAGICTFEAMLE